MKLGEARTGRGKPGLFPTSRSMCGGGKARCLSIVSKGSFRTRAVDPPFDRTAALAGFEPFDGSCPFTLFQLSQPKLMAHLRNDGIGEVAGNHLHLQTEDRMATAGTIVLEIKIAIDIVLAEDGKYYVDAVTMKSGGTALEWTEGPFDTEVKARENLKWQVAVPVIEKL